MDEIAAFLRGCYAKEKAAAQDSRRVADIESKLSIVDLCELPLVDVSLGGKRELVRGEGEPWGHSVLQRLALPYSDRPGYKEAWRP